MAPKIRTLGSSIEQIKILNSEFAMSFVYLRYGTTILLIMKMTTGENPKSPLLRLHKSNI